MFPEGSSSIFKWNEVTWYSRLAAIVVLFGAVPSLFFYIGVRYEQATGQTIQQTSSSLSAASNSNNPVPEASTSESSPFILAGNVCPIRQNDPLATFQVFDGNPTDLADLMPDTDNKTISTFSVGYIYDQRRYVTVRCEYANGETYDAKLNRVNQCVYRLQDKSLNCN